MTKRRARRGSSSRSMPTSHGRSSSGAASIGGSVSGRGVPARTSTRADPGAGHAVQVDRGMHASRRARSSASTSSRSCSAGSGTTTTTWESGRAAKAAKAAVSSRWARAPRPASVRRGTRRPPGWPQTTTMPGPCHSASCLGDVAAGRPASSARVVGGEQEVAEHHDPPAEGDVDRAPASGRVASAAPSSTSASHGHAASIVSPTRGRRPPESAFGPGRGSRPAR